MPLSKKLMNHEIILPIIGYMNAPYYEKFGIPRQPNLVNSISYIVMQAPYDDLRAFTGIEQFSHIWLLWQFHDNKRINHAKDFQPLIRPPRLGGNQKIGVFASRSMYRPSPIGLSVVEFVEVKRVEGQTRLYVRGADLLNQTPILDIKPYLAYADAIVDAKSGYAQQAPERLAVYWSASALAQRLYLLEHTEIEARHIAELEEVLALNPTPAYQKDEQRVYGLRFSHMNVKFQIVGDKVMVQELTHI